MLAVVKYEAPVDDIMGFTVPLVTVMELVTGVETIDAMHLIKYSWPSTGVSGSEAVSAVLVTLLRSTTWLSKPS